MIVSRINPARPSQYHARPSAFLGDGFDTSLLAGTANAPAAPSPDERGSKSSVAHDADVVSSDPHMICYRAATLVAPLDYVAECFIEPPGQYLGR